MKIDLFGDVKNWCAISCPVDGLRFDARTLAFLDSDGDGHIRTPEVLAAVEFMKSKGVEPEELLRPASPETESRLADVLAREKDLASVEPSRAEIDALAARNASDTWLFPDRDFLSRYTYRKKKRFPFGTVALSLSMKNERIEEAHISGDFFGVAPASLIEAALVGQSLATVPAALASVPLGDCIAGMTEEDFLSLLSE